MIKADKPENTMEYEKAKQGTHIARMYKIIDLGTQESEWQGDIKHLRKIRLFWELPNEPKEYEDKDGKKIKSVMSISREFTLSMGSKSNLRPIVEGMIGTSLEDSDAYGFDIEELLGKACLLKIVYRKSADGSKEFAIAEGTSELMKDQKCPEGVNEQVIIKADLITAEQLEKLPTYLAERIAKSPEYKKETVSTEAERNEIAELKKPSSKSEAYGEDSINPEDIPF